MNDWRPSRDFTVVAIGVIVAGMVGVGDHIAIVLWFPSKALMGGNVRVGLEDSLSIAPGRLATSNAEQVKKIRGVLEALGFEIASPAEARAMLGLKGRDKVNLQ